VVRAKDDALPNANLWRNELLPRYEARVRENLRGKVREVGLTGADVLDSTVKSVNTKRVMQPWTPAGLELMTHEAMLKAESVIDMSALKATAAARDHLDQLRSELSSVPEPTNPFAAAMIWQKLDGTAPHERNTLISRTTDPMVVSAVLHAPSVFQLGSDDARRRMLESYNRAHRAAKVALMGDLADFVAVVDEVASGIKRELRGVLR
jgi:hypothetical protein